MEMLLILLCSVIFGSFSFGFFCLGYYVRSKKPTNEGLTITEQNKEFVEEMAKWRNYFGGNH